MQTVFNDKLCIECDACVDICPMDCITFTANGEEAELRPRLMAPALNLTQDIYVSPALKTGRIMAKDEDVCLHCGLCAERCPTGAWDMQKFLLEMAHAGEIAQPDAGADARGRAAGRGLDANVQATWSNLLARINDFVVKFANVNGSGSASANGLFAKAVLKMGVPVAARNIFPSNIQGLPTWYEVRVVEAGWRGRRGGVDLMVAMNPETWIEDVLEIEPGGYLFYDSTKPLPPSKFREDVTVVAMPLMAICNATYSGSTAAAALQEHHLPRRARRPARHRARGHRDAARRAVQGQAAAAGVEPQGVPARIRLRGRELQADRPQDRAARQGRRPHLHRRQQCGGAGRRLRRRDRLRVVPDHAVVVARGSLREALRALSRRSRDAASIATRSCRPKTSSRRSAS